MHNLLPAGYTNDVFEPMVVSGIGQVVMTISNRWGKQIFKTGDPQLVWDGKNSSGEWVSDGVYFYTIEVKGLSGDVQKFSGTVTVQF